MLLLGRIYLVRSQQLPQMANFALVENTGHLLRWFCCRWGHCVFSSRTSYICVTSREPGLRCCFRCSRWMRKRWTGHRALRRHCTGLLEASHMIAATTRSICPQPRCSIAAGPSCNGTLHLSLFFLNQTLLLHERKLLLLCRLTYLLCSTHGGR